MTLVIYKQSSKDPICVSLLMDRYLKRVSFDCLDTQIQTMCTVMTACGMWHVAPNIAYGTYVSTFHVTSPNFDVVNKITILLLVKSDHENIMMRTISYFSI